MTRITDLSDQRFGTLLVKSRVPGPGQVKWLCVCDCKIEMEVFSSNLVTGRTQSCGYDCVLKKPNCDFPEHSIWIDMRSRCNTESYKWYKNYGGRGIRVDPSWDSFEKFYADVGPRPSVYHTLERIDNNGNYEPGNVEWATRHTQARNRRSNVFLTLEGKTLCVRDWSKKTGLCEVTIRKRRSEGWSDEKILTTPGKGRYKLSPGAIYKLVLREIRLAKSRRENRQVVVRDEQHDVLREAVDRVYADKMLMEGIRKISEMGAGCWLIELYENPE